jgi:hypothetical protein
MFRTLAIAAALVMLAGSASATKIDKNGKCHDDKGRFAKMEVCKGGAAPAATASIYKLDAKGNCHGAGGKMVKKELCKA